MQIIVFKNFSKRTNSTKQPADNTGTTINVELKANTSVEKPTFILSQSTDFLGINYIKAFGNYYKVDDTIILDNNRVEIPCTHDYLATYKSDILNTSAYIMYSESLHNDNVNDNRVVSLNTVTIKTLTQPTSVFDNTGYYMLTCVGESDYSTPTFTKSYLMTSIQMRDLVNELMSASDTVLTNLSKRFKSPYDCIVSCKWLPFNSYTIATNRCVLEEHIHLGSYDTGVHGYVVSDDTPFSAVTGFDLANVLSTIQPAYKRVAPYTKLSAFIPYFSSVTIPMLPFVKTDKILNFRYSIDFITGDVTVRVTTSNTDVIVSTYNYNVSVDIPVAQLMDNKSSLLTSIGSIASSAGLVTAGGGAGALLSLAVAGVNAGMEAVTEKPSVKGSQGGRSYREVGINTVLTFETLDTTTSESISSLFGKPYMAIATLSNCTGYVQTQNASVNIAGRTDDSVRLNALLDAGIYIE